VARRKDEAQEIIPDVVVQRRIDVHGSGFDPLLSVGIEYLMRAIEPRRAGAGYRWRGVSLSHEHARDCRNADFRPSLERGDEGILCKSSATPTSRTIRASPAMSRGDSIRQTASIVRRTSGAVTLRAPALCARRLASWAAPSSCIRSSCAPTSGVTTARILGLGDLTDLDLVSSRQTLGKRLTHSIASPWIALE